MNPRRKLGKGVKKSLRKPARREEEGLSPGRRERDSGRMEKSDNRWRADPFNHRLRGPGFKRAFEGKVRTRANLTLKPKEDGIALKSAGTGGYSAWFHEVAEGPLIAVGIREKTSNSRGKDLL